jgi:hypothetical protein
MPATSWCGWGEAMSAELDAAARDIMRKMRADSVADLVRMAQQNWKIIAALPQLLK